MGGNENIHNNSEIHSTNQIQVNQSHDTFINLSIADIDLISHECCGIINVDDEDGILKMHQMLFKRFNKQK